MRTRKISLERKLLSREHHYALLMISMEFAINLFDKLI